MVEEDDGGNNLGVKSLSLDEDKNVLKDILKIDEDVRIVGKVINKIGVKDVVKKDGVKGNVVKGKKVVKKFVKKLVEILDEKYKIF